MDIIANEFLKLSNFQRAWEKVAENRGCAGVDGETIDKFASNQTINIYQLRDAVSNSAETSEPDNVRMRRSLKSFLHRIYYDLRNLGQLDRDRALNFAATNAFQAASTFAEINSGIGLY